MKLPLIDEIKNCVSASYSEKYGLEIERDDEHLESLLASQASPKGDKDSSVVDKILNLMRETRGEQPRENTFTDFIDEMRDKLENDDDWVDGVVKKTPPAPLEDIPTTADMVEHMNSTLYAKDEKLYKKRLEDIPSDDIEKLILKIDGIIDGYNYHVGYQNSIADLRKIVYDYWPTAVQRTVDTSVGYLTRQDIKHHFEKGYPELFMKGAIEGDEQWEASRSNIVYYFLRERMPWTLKDCPESYKRPMPSSGDRDSVINLCQSSIDALIEREKKAVKSNIQKAFILGLELANTTLEELKNTPLYSNKE